MALTLRKIGVFWVALAIACLCAFFPAHTAYADQGHNKVAPPEQMASSKALTLEGMKPITADQVKEGTYDIKAESSSSFFKIKGAKLTVRDGAMTAAISLDSKSYPLVYMGTGEDAAAAPAEDYIEFDGDSWTFTVPVSALDQEIDCAAYSKRKKQWYDRKLMFYAATLPEGAVLVDLPEYGDPVEASGASAAKAATDIALNKVGNENPETGAVPNAYARLLWSSSYYDYMIVDEVRYDNQTDDGSNSTFVIPILAMDEEIPVIADTTAMGDPVEIDYNLTFYSNTVDDKDAIPQEAAVKVLILALIIIAVGGVLNYVLKKRRKQ